MIKISTQAKVVTVLSSILTFKRTFVTFNPSPRWISKHDSNSFPANTYWRCHLTHCEQNIAWHWSKRCILTFFYWFHGRSWAYFCIEEYINLFCISIKHEMWTACINIRWRSHYQRLTYNERHRQNCTHFKITANIESYFITQCF